MKMLKSNLIAKYLCNLLISWSGPVSSQIICMSKASSKISSLERVHSLLESLGSQVVAFNIRFLLLLCWHRYIGEKK